MALFVQIDHFRKTDQKPTVKNHLFSISWFRRLQSYILSTTTETKASSRLSRFRYGFNRTSFQQQLKHIERIGRIELSKASIVHPFNNNWNTSRVWRLLILRDGFNRTSFQQQLKRVRSLLKNACYRASIVHPFNNNWNAIAAIRLLSAFINASIVHPFNNNWNNW